MSFRKTLVFALILVGLLYYIKAVELPKEESEKSKDVIFSDVSTEEFKKIKVTNEKGSFELVNSDPKKLEGQSSLNTDPKLDLWKIESLPEAEIDKGPVTALLSGIKDLKADTRVPNEDIESDLSVYGFKEPSINVEVSYGSKAVKLEFGKKSDYVQKRYVKVSGTNNQDGIILVPDTLFTTVSKSREEFRNKNPLIFNDTDIKKVSLIHQGKDISLEQGEKGDWDLVSPISARGSHASVSALLRELRNLKAAEFFDETPPNLAARGLDKPDVHVTLNFVDSVKKDPIEVRIKRAEKDKEIQKVWFSVSGKNTVFKSEIDPIAQIAQPVDSFREKKLFDFAVDNVIGGEIVVADKVTITMKKQGVGKDSTDWIVNDKPGDYVFIREVLTNAANLEAVDFPKQDLDFGFTKPNLKFTVTLASSDGKETVSHKLTIGNKRQTSSGVQYYAESDRSGAPFLISEDSLKKLMPHEEALLKQPTPIPAASESTPSQEGAPTP